MDFGTARGGSLTTKGHLLKFRVGICSTETYLAGEGCLLIFFAMWMEYGRMNLLGMTAFGLSLNHRKTDTSSLEQSMSIWFNLLVQIIPSDGMTLRNSWTAVSKHTFQSLNASAGSELPSGLPRHSASHYMCFACFVPSLRRISHF